MNHINAIQFSEACASSFRNKWNETQIYVSEMLVFRVSNQLMCVWFV